MKQLIIVAGLFVLLPVTGSAADYRPEFITETSQVCIERLEEQGLLNVFPVTVNFADQASITLTGGQAGCIYTRPGEQMINLTFFYPYGGPNEQRAWSTPVMMFFLEKGARASFQLCEAGDQSINDPKWRATGWHNMWLLKRANELTSQKCAVQFNP